MKYLYKIILCLFFFQAFLPAQINRNNSLALNLIKEKYNFTNTYITDINERILNSDRDSSKNYNVGIQANFSLQNTAVTPEWNYNDKVNYAFSPYVFGRVSDNIEYYISALVQNTKSDIVNPQKYFMGSSRMGHWGDIEIAKICYKTDHFNIKFGRDYFMLGMYLTESMLFSQYQRPYDQIYLSYKNNLVEVSSYYLQLSNMKIEGDYHTRHLNGHRISLNLFDKGYVAINEYILYEGIKEPIHLALFNPFLLYYFYHSNERIEGTNTMLSFDWFYKINKLFLSGEIIVDDFMIDKDIYADLEPNKIGFNITFGMLDILPNLNWNVNYTLLNNRVYATGNGTYSEYLMHKNLPIGYTAGSNLWDFENNLSYLGKNFTSELSFIYRLSGDDAVYSDYNRDHYQGHEWDDPLEPNAEWKETIPYVSGGGAPDKYYGFIWNNYYNIYQEIGLNIKMSYWFENELLNNSFNISVGIFVNLRI